MQSITPEVAKACKRDKVMEWFSFSDKDGVTDATVEHMLAKDQIGIDGPRLAIYELDESLRMTSFKVYHVTDFSEFSRELIWNTIEVRVVCLVEKLSIPLEAYPPNHFEVFSYDSLLQGGETKLFKVDGRIV